MVGMAWQTGVVAGLAQSGVNLHDADMILGTAAGASLAWRLAAGQSAADLAAAIDHEAYLPPASNPTSRTTPPSGIPDLLWRQFKAEMAGEDTIALRRQIGALAMPGTAEDEASFLEKTDQFIPIGRDQPWPAAFSCSAIDAETGELVVWQAASTIALSQGVASSCSVPISNPPVTIGGRRFISGAMRSVSNVDLATGYDNVLVIAMRSPPGDARMAERMQQSLDFEVSRLRKDGTTVDVIQPDEASMAAIGHELADVLDLRRRPAACKAGIDQGKSLAGSIKPGWGQSDFLR